MKASDYIALFLEKKGIKYVFELSGGMITHLLDSFHQKTAINIVTMHHEQSAAFAADGYARENGLPGVALATSGPGATNLLTGIGSCYFDSVPGIFITGQVNTHEQKGDRAIRQLGFQETDIVSMAQSVTKKSFRVQQADQLPAILEEAFQLSMEGRPGPVLIDIPMNVQREQVNADSLSAATLAQKEEMDISSEMEKLYQAIQVSKRPLVLAGRGICASFSRQFLSEFLSLTKLPVVTSLLAVDALPYNHQQRVGFIGSYGNRWANIAFGESDLLIVLGSRLDIRQTGAITNIFENRPVFQVDCELAEINNRVKNCIPVVCDLRYFFKTFNRQFGSAFFEAKETWNGYIQSLREKWPDTRELDTKGINPNTFMHMLSRASSGAMAYISDVGAHQMWAAQSLEITGTQRFHTSAGMGAMGFALPAAIGCCFAAEKRPVIALIGDGSMQINIQELQTVVRNGLPVKIVVMNNQNLGMIRQFQDSYFESRYQSTWWGYSAPDFEKIAHAYGLLAKTISETAQMEEGISWLWEEENITKPQLLQVMIDPYTNTYPKIAFGKPITEMEPFSKPLDMEGT